MDKDKIDELYLALGSEEDIEDHFSKHHPATKEDLEVLKIELENILDDHREKVLQDIRIILDEERERSESFFTGPYLQRLLTTCSVKDLFQFGLVLLVVSFLSG